jgi:hypothetical protein
MNEESLGSTADNERTPSITPRKEVELTIDTGFKQPIKHETHSATERHSTNGVKTIYEPASGGHHTRSKTYVTEGWSGKSAGSHRRNNSHFQPPVQPTQPIQHQPQHQHHDRYSYTQTPLHNNSPQFNHIQTSYGHHRQSSHQFQEVRNNNRDNNVGDNTLDVNTVDNNRDNNVDNTVDSGDNCGDTTDSLPEETPREIRNEHTREVRIDIPPSREDERKRKMYSQNSKSVVDMLNKKRVVKPNKRRSNQIVSDIISRSHSPNSTSLGESSDSETGLNSPVGEGVWTDETIKQLIEFSDICNYSANQCKRSAMKHRRIGQCIEIMVILIGSLSALSSAGNFIDTETKLLISTICGLSTAVFTGVQGFLKFLPRSEVELNSWLELEKIGRSIKMEITKSVNLRVDPYKLILRLERQRDKIIRKVGIGEEI